MPEDGERALGGGVGSGEVCVDDGEAAYVAAAALGAACRTAEACLVRRHSGLATASHCTGCSSAARTSVPARPAGWSALLGHRSSSASVGGRVRIPYGS